MEKDVEVVFVSGLSGSGKTTAMAALEDLSFYCVDNLPPELVDQFLELCSHKSPPIQKIALAIDARENTFLAGVPDVIDRLRASGASVRLICLDCSNAALLNRYRETRRVHPLSPTGSVAEGIERERQLLLEVFRRADLIVDTSRLNVHQLRETVVRTVAGGSRSIVVNIVSFGFRAGAPQAAELLFDVRFLPNPHFEPHLREETGLHAEVAAYVLENDRAVEFLDKLQDLFRFLLPLYEAEGKSYLTIGIGCTGGQHRSVAVAERVAEELRTEGREVNIQHRDAKAAE
ncbi:MAG: RNase adapter RapZ [Myxococcales bacterium]|nr:RNase adapter RapZ [Myxococcales bacterium]